TRFSRDWSSDVCSSDLGVRLYADGLVTDPAQGFDTVLVAGAPQVDLVRLTDTAIKWLRDAAGSAHRYGSVCTGVFALAQSGLLRSEERRVGEQWSARRA